MIFGNSKHNRDNFHTEALPHMDALYNAAVYMTRDLQDAEDLVQETYVKAFRFFHRYKPGTNCKAWLFRIMTNTHINRNRGKRREYSFIENIDADTSELSPMEEKSAWYKGPEQSYLHQLLHDEVKDALDSLPTDFRAVVVLADLQDFSYKEIAEIVDCPIGTVMSRLHRGRKMLQKSLRRYAISTGLLPSDSRDESHQSKEPTSLEDFRRRRAGTKETGGNDAV